MRPVAIAVVAAMALAPATAVQTTVAAAAGTLFESVPFVLAGLALAAASARWATRTVPYLGCGCGTGPSARSLPAALATWLLFGPLVAAARLAAAVAAAWLLARRAPRCCSHGAHASEPGEHSALAQLQSIAPLAIVGGAVAPAFVAFAGLALVPPPVAFAAGALAGFAIAPCALGAAGLGACLRSAAPAAALGFLCVAGIADLRAFVRPRARPEMHDAVAYALLAAGCAFVAWRGGDTLVHPRFALPLWGSAVTFLWLAWRRRFEQAPPLRWGPAMMLVTAVLGAPAPQYHATQTTLARAFAGEHVDFTGVVTRTLGATALVRFAITCCRADAAPVVLRLQRGLPDRAGPWVRARGVIVQTPAGLRLRVDRYRTISAPADPFVYR